MNTSRRPTASRPVRVAARHDARINPVSSKRTDVEASAELNERALFLDPQALQLAQLRLGIPRALRASLLAALLLVSLLPLPVRAEDSNAVQSSTEPSSEETGIDWWAWLSSGQTEDPTTTTTTPPPGDGGSSEDPGHQQGG